MGTSGKNRSVPEGPSGSIRAQLKCRASATQQQPPINKRDYRCTTSRISVEDCSVTSQPVRRWWLREPPPQNSLFSLSRLSFSLSPLRSFSFYPRVSPIPSLSLSLSPLFFLSFARAHTQNTHIRTRARNGQTFCLLPLALTIKRWRRLARAAMFLIPLSVSPANPLLATLAAEKARNV